MMTVYLCKRLLDVRLLEERAGTLLYALEQLYSIGPMLQFSWPL